MEDIKMILRILTIIIGVLIYIAIWVSLFINWDKCVCTAYCYPCWQNTLGNFYGMWIAVHVILILSAFAWAWEL